MQIMFVDHNFHIVSGLTWKHISNISEIEYAVPKARIYVFWPLRKSLTKGKFHADALHSVFEN